MNASLQRTRAALIVFTIIAAPLYVFGLLGNFADAVFIAGAGLWMGYLIWLSMWEEYPQIDFGSPIAIGVIALSTLVAVSATLVAIWHFELSGVAVGGAAMLGAPVYFGLSRAVLGCPKRE